jgi:hypothetical protein
MIERIDGNRVNQLDAIDQRLKFWTNQSTACITPLPRRTIDQPTIEDQIHFYLVVGITFERKDVS